MKIISDYDCLGGVLISLQIMSCFMISDYDASDGLVYAIKISPQEYRYIPINGEPHITDNRVSVKQEWSLHLNLDNIIDKNGNFVCIDAVRSCRKPYEYEFNALKKVTKDFLDVYSGGRLGANRVQGGRSGYVSEDYNVYGRLVTKRKKGCSFFYSLLNAHAKTDGWTKCCIKIESKAENVGLDWECDEYEIIAIVKQVNKSPYYI